MLKKIFVFFFIFLLQFKIVFSADNSGNDGVQSIKPKTSIAKEPVKITYYISAEKQILKAKKLEKKGKNKKAEVLYREALTKLYKANKLKPFHPDILNYLGFVNRKINNLDDAEIYYVMGLEIDPNHKGINEYLGELYVATNRIDLAKERLKVLENCNCAEYTQLNEIIAGTKESKY